MNTFFSQELRFADLGDQRLNRRLERLVTALADKPAASVPHALDDWGQTKAAYRFWDNERVDPDDIRRAHRQATVDRLPDAGVVLAIQDTTALSFTSHKAVRGLGYLTQRHQRGLLVHSLLGRPRRRRPLGRGASGGLGPVPQAFRPPPQPRPPAHRPQGKPTLADRDARGRRPGRPPAFRRGRGGSRGRPVRPVRGPCARRAWTCSCGPNHAAACTGGWLLGEAAAAAPVLGALTVTLPRADDRPARTATLRCGRPP